jgi:hypothetical protein
MKKSGLVFLCIGVLVSFVFAGQKNTEIVTERKLKEKIGVGFNSSIENRGVNAIAGRYWLTDVVGIEGFLGFKMYNKHHRDEDYHHYKNRYVFGAKVLYVLKSYKSLNIFSTASLDLFIGYVAVGRIATGLGVEWFVLNDLSLSTEAGLCFRTGDGVIGLETYIESIPKISIKYYL